MPGNFGAITPTDIIGSNQSAIQQALQSLRSRVNTTTPWTYGDEGISDAQRNAGTQAGLLRGGGAGIGQLLGFSATEQGARSGAYVGAGGGGVLSGLQADTAKFMDAPTYQAPPPTAPTAPTATPRTRPDAGPTGDLPPMYRGRPTSPDENPRLPSNRRPLTPATGRGGGFYGAP